jgi:hypothetical protein
MMPKFFVSLQRFAPSSAVKPVSISQQVSPILSNPKSALCFLRCSGCNLIDLRSKGRRKVFVFRAHRSTIGLTIRERSVARRIGQPARHTQASFHHRPTVERRRRSQIRSGK